MTTETTFLTAVPFPLLAPSSQLLAEGLPVVHESETTAIVNPSMQERMFQNLMESLVDVSLLPTRPQNIRERFALEHQLYQVFGTYYHSSSKPTKALKLAAIYSSLKKLDLPNIRLSRQTAAWIWGYLPAQEIIHIDFERSRRAATYRMIQHSIRPHQLNEFSDGETISFFGIDVTTPLRTVLDVLQFEDQTTALSVIQGYLADTEQDMDLAMLINVAERQKHLQNREYCLEMLNQLKQKAGSFS